MAAKDLGTKFTCFKCGTKFYDLGKPEPLCPKCGADQRERPPEKPERKRASRTSVEEPVLEEEVLEDEDVQPEDDEVDEVPESDDEDL